LKKDLNQKRPDPWANRMRKGGGVPGDVYEKCEKKTRGSGKDNLVYKEAGKKKKKKTTTRERVPKNEPGEERKRKKK